jgi:hypothetical protein
MPDVYKLQLEIPDEALGAIAPGCRIAIARACGNAEPNVVWAAADPARSHVVTWDDSYGVHASALPSGRLTPLQLLGSVHPARERMVYPFSGGAFRAPAESRRIPYQHYNVRNDGREALFFGLVAGATVDGTAAPAPLNAVVVPRDFTADFCPDNKVYVWLQFGVVAGSIVAAIPPNAAVIVCDPTNRAARLRYDEPSRAFITRGVA